MFIVYVGYAFRKWCTVFKYDFNISIITCFCYVSCYKNICVWTIAKTWFNGLSFKFNGRTIFISFTINCIILIIDTIPFSFASFKDSLLVSTNRFAFLCVSIIISSQNKKLLQHFVRFKSCFFWLFDDEKHCCSISFKFSSKINLLF